MIVLVLLGVAHLSRAAVPMMRNMMDPQIISIDDVEGYLYDVPEYEDPLLVQHQLSSIGAMPIFTLLESVNKRGNSKIDDFPEKIKVVESKKVLDEVISHLELTRAKLEEGNINIHADTEKAIQSLKSLEKHARPDIRQILSSLQSIMTMAKPIKMSETKEFIRTSEDESGEKTGVLEKPQNFDSQALSVRVISNDKSELDEEPSLENTPNSSLSMDNEKSSEEEGITEERSKPSESSEIPKENNEATKPPQFEFKRKEKKNSSLDGEDVVSSYKAKLTWKAAGIV